MWPMLRSAVREVIAGRRPERDQSEHGELGRGRLVNLHENRRDETTRDSSARRGRSRHRCRCHRRIRRATSPGGECGSSSVTAAPFWLEASDSVRLYAVEEGSGPIGVVLAHESPGDLCGWLPYVPMLAGAGVRALAFDFRGFGDSDRPASTRDFLAYGRDLRAAVARLRAEGARNVFLFGASFGGAAALTYAPSLPIDGVVSFSGETDIREPGSTGLRPCRGSACRS